MKTVIYGGVTETRAMLLQHIEDFGQGLHALQIQLQNTTEEETVICQSIGVLAKRLGLC